MSLWLAAVALLRAFFLTLRVYLVGLRLVLKQLLFGKIPETNFYAPVGRVSVVNFKVPDGRVAMVTGGATGIGYHTAKGLAKQGMHVFIAGNDVLEGTAAAQAIQKETENDDVEFTLCDLASLTLVRRCAERFRTLRLPLHLLVLNAGVMLVPEARTEDGFEVHFGVNYMGHFLLTNLLLGPLEVGGARGRCARVVTVASATHHLGALRLEALQEPPGKRRYSPHGAYAQSKLALVMFTYRLQKYLTSSGSNVTANVVDPGVVNTELYRHVCFPARVLKKLGGWLLLRSPQQGAAACIHAALAPQLEGVGGCYFYDGKKAQSSDMSYNEELQRELWAASCKLVGEPDVTIEERQALNDELDVTTEQKHALTASPSQLKNLKRSISDKTLKRSLSEWHVTVQDP